jgi:hypothetical protein
MAAFPPLDPFEPPLASVDLDGVDEVVGAEAIGAEAIGDEAIGDGDGAIGEAMALVFSALSGSGVFARAYGS